nr:MAG TPA: peptidoglycan hydrolase [Caudoviricetes sp.]
MNIEQMIKWMTDREGKVTYSMTSRLGPKSYDCSSAVFFSMIDGGFLPRGSMGNTETLFAMSGTKLKKISRSEVKRGDIFVAGTPGASHGSAGHTGIFLSNKSFIHCSYYWNGIHTDSHDSYMSTRLPHHFYRIVATENTTTGGKSIEAVAKEVINGLWGNGDDRKKKLAAAGYSYDTVQAKVTELLKGSSSSQASTNPFANIGIDSNWDGELNGYLQRYYGTIIDKVISGQIKGDWNAGMTGIQFGTGGSDLVAAIQKDLGLKVDRNMGPGTIGSMQAKAGTAVDRKITRPSALAKQIKTNLKTKGKPW